MNQTLNKAFLEKYKNFESVMTSKGLTVKEFEDLVQDADVSNRLRLCRSVRNFLSHNSVDFISATQEMVSFIDDLIVQHDETQIPIKKKASPLSKGLDYKTATVRSAIEFLVKRKVDKAPIFKDGELMGIATSERIFKTLLEPNAKPTSKLSAFPKMFTASSKEVLSVGPTVPYSEVYKEDRLVLVKEKGVAVGYFTK